MNKPLPPVDAVWVEAFQIKFSPGHWRWGSHTFRCGAHHGTDVILLNSHMHKATKLADFIQPIVPRQLSRLGVDACNAYEHLPGELQYRPNNPNEVSGRVLSYGVPLAIIGNNPSFERLIKPFVPNILQKGKMPQDTWSVMHAGVVLTLLDGKIEFVKEASHPTPDIRCVWDGKPFDCEVTSPLVKEQQRQLDAFVRNLTEAIGTGGRDWHLLVHLADLPNSENQNRVVDAVLELQPGQQFDVPNVLEVRAVDEGEALAGGPELEKLRPTWWNNDGPTLNSSSLLLGGEGVSDRRLRISAMLPFISIF